MNNNKERVPHSSCLQSTVQGVPLSFNKNNGGGAGNTMSLVLYESCPPPIKKINDFEEGVGIIFKR